MSNSPNLAHMSTHLAQVSPNGPWGPPLSSYVAVHAAHRTALFDPLLHSIVPHKTQVSPP